MSRSSSSSKQFVCLFLVLVLVPSYLLARSCSSSSSMLLVCLFLVLVLVPLKKLLNPIAFFISSHMSYA